MKTIEEILKASSKIPGWTRGDEAQALVEAAVAAPEGAVIVEVGSFMGGGSVILAGARKMMGSGKVHCVDPFDGSGDATSLPHYEAIALAFGGRPFRELFDENIADNGLSDYVVAHSGDAADISESWTTPIDLLYLDGDQSVAGALAAFQGFAGWLKTGGVIAVHNSLDREYEPDHDGQYRVARDEVVAPAFEDVYMIGSTTFARRSASDE